MKKRTEAVRNVVIHKAPGEALGISIKGGAEHRLPVMISALREGGAADVSGACFVGDEILKVGCACACVYVYACVCVCVCVLG